MKVLLVSWEYPPVVIGGLVTSTLLTLLVLPTVYSWFTARRTEVEI